jgi:mRNA interferase RelE/StbE
MPLYAVIYRPSADKALKKLPKRVQRRIVLATEASGVNPRPLQSLKMQGQDNLWRIRVGDYRIVYTIEDGQLIVLVIRIAHRKDVYRGK